MRTLFLTLALGALCLSGCKHCTTSQCPAPAVVRSAPIAVPTAPGCCPAPAATAPVVVPPPPPVPVAVPR